MLHIRMFDSSRRRSLSSILRSLSRSPSDARMHAFSHSVSESIPRSEEALDEQQRREKRKRGREDERGDRLKVSISLCYECMLCAANMRTGETVKCQTVATTEEKSLL